MEAAQHVAAQDQARKEKVGHAGYRVDAPRLHQLSGGAVHGRLAVVRLGHRHRVAGAKSLLHQRPQVFEPEAVVVLALGARLDHENAREAGGGAAVLDVLDPFHDQVGQARVGTEAVRQIQPYFRELCPHLVEYLVEFEGCVLAVAEQEGHHHHLAQAPPVQHADSLVRVRLDELQARQDDLLVPDPQLFLYSSRRRPQTVRGARAVLAPSGDSLFAPSAGAFHPAVAPLAAVGQQDDAPTGKLDTVMRGGGHVPSPRRASPNSAFTVAAAAELPPRRPEIVM